MYEAEYLDVYKVELTANLIDEAVYKSTNIYSNEFLLFKAVLDHHKDVVSVSKGEGLIKCKDRDPGRSKNTKVWKLLLKWAYGTESWSKP